MSINLPDDLDVSILTVIPKEPFFEWAKKLEDIDESDQELELDDLRNDTSAYVVPPIESIEDIAGALELCHKTIFENELYGWTQDTSLWPEDRGVDVFNEWFGVSIHSMAFDLTEAVEE